MTDQNDEYYLDMLDGLAIYYDSPLLTHLSRTIADLRPAGLGYAMNANQMRGKKWLIDTLADMGLTRFSDCLVLGGWFGVLSALLMNDARFSLRRTVSLDLDPECQAVAESLNRKHASDGTFAAVTADMLSFDYQVHFAGGPVPGSGEQRLIVNTSCEHLPDPARWLAGIGPDQLLVLQSNDYFSCDEHVSCVTDAEAFARQMPLSRLLFSGSLKLKRYTRFMQIGYRDR